MLTLSGRMLEGREGGGQMGGPDPHIPLASQIAAQELSDNQVITLSLAGRKLDKKVRQSRRGFSIREQYPSPSPGSWGLVLLLLAITFITPHPGSSP